MTKLLITYPGLLLIGFSLTPSAIAQVTSDNTLSTTVDSTNGTDFTIENGERAGNNLFHSFQDFSVPNNGSATFNNALEIENIFSRVTGGNISNIEGAINAGGTANLLLINPAGIIFGENASLNIGGSFLGTTADSLLFPEREFSAVNPQAAPLLTINRPIGLKFNNPGSIVNRSGTLTDPVAPPPGLQVQPGQNITLVGGEIQLDGGFATASGGKIELGSVAAAAVSFNFANSDYELNYEAVANFGDIFLRDLSGIDVSGLGGGEVRLQGRNIVLTGGAKVNSNTFGDLPGKDITIAATESVQISGATDTPNLFEPTEAGLGVLVPLRSTITSNTFNTGDAGDIKIDTQRLILDNGGHLTASTVPFFDILSSSPGAGGNIEINASETVEVRNVVEVNTIGEAEQNDPFALGREGIEANGVSSIVTVTLSTANAGNMTINTGKLTVADGGAIGTSSFGDGAGGTIAIDATESIDVSGSSPIGVFPSAIASNTVATGTSGDIRINTEQLKIRDSGVISTQNNNIGRAGNIEIDVRNLLLNDGFLSAATQAGDRGNINVNNAETILLRNNAQITTNATELSTGGDINLDAGAIAVLNNSNITAIAEAGQGGNIQITTQGLFIEPDSEITAASELGIDGTITFNTPDVDPTSGIIELPTVPIDVEAILARDLCRVENENIAGGSSFIVTGRGGLTPTSAESLGNINRVVGWTDEAVEVSGDSVLEVRRKKDSTVVSTVVQSQGLVMAADGSLWLTADASQTIPQTSSAIHPTCST